MIMVADGILMNLLIALAVITYNAQLVSAVWLNKSLVAGTLYTPTNRKSSKIVANDSMVLHFHANTDEYKRKKRVKSHSLEIKQRLWPL